MSERVPRFARWVVGISSWIVPGHRRSAWRRQWIAEVEHRCAGKVERGGSERLRSGHSRMRSICEERR